MLLHRGTDDHAAPAPSVTLDVVEVFASGALISGPRSSPLPVGVGIELRCGRRAESFVVDSAYEHDSRRTFYSVRMTGELCERRSASIWRAGARWQIGRALADHVG